MVNTMKKKFMQKLHLKKGALHRQLGIPVGKKIPTSTLEKIIKAEIGSKVKVDGYRKVTGKLKKRSVLARTMRKF